jgi:hypothetical protein
MKWSDASKKKQTPYDKYKKSSVRIEVSVENDLDDIFLETMANGSRITNLEIVQSNDVVSKYTSKMYKHSNNVHGLTSLKIYSINYQKTKHILTALRQTHSHKLIIIFLADVTNPKKVYSMHLKPAMLQPESIHFGNIRTINLPHMKEILKHYGKKLEELTLDDVSKEVNDIGELKTVKILRIPYSATISIGGTNKIERIHLFGELPTHEVSTNLHNKIASMFMSCNFPHLKCVVVQASINGEYFVLIVDREYADLHTTKQFNGKYGSLFQHNKQLTITTHEKISKKWEKYARYEE